MPYILPTFMGYTVDVNCRQFIKAVPNETLEFIPFNSERGRELLDMMHELLLEPLSHALI